MSTYLCSYEPKHRKGPFVAFTATSKHLTHNPSVACDAYPRIAINGDPFFPTLKHVRMAINRLSSNTYGLYLNTTTNKIEGCSRRRRTENLRALTLDDFTIEAHLYTPHTIVLQEATLRGDVTPAQLLGIPEPTP